MAMTPDQVYTTAQLDAFDAAAYLEQLASEPVVSLADLQVRDATWLAAFAAIDLLAARAMKLLLDQALALEPTVPAVTRNVFSTTIVQYVERLDLLAQRVHDLAARGGARHPGDVAEVVVAAAREVLGLRSTLREGVLGKIREASTASVAAADLHARDRGLDDNTRKQWSRMRRDLELLAADPMAIGAGPLATRLAALPDQLDDAPTGPELSFADLIELD